MLETEDPCTNNAKTKPAGSFEFTYQPDRQQCVQAAKQQGGFPLETLVLLLLGNSEAGA